MKKYLLFAFVGFLIFSCKQQPSVSENKKEEVSKKDIAQTILSDDSSFYYIDFNAYPKKRKELPIGIFDSGTGGLTVFDAIVNFDKFNNSTKRNGSDGKIDFNKESFIYLGRSG